MFYKNLKCKLQFTNPVNPDLHENYMSRKFSTFPVIYIYIYIYIYVYIYIYLFIITKIIPGFRCISSLYCYSSVSYGQRMTTLFRQYWRILPILQDSPILPEECGHPLAIRNRAVAIKRWTTSEAWNNFRYNIYCSWKLERSLKTILHISRLNLYIYLTIILRGRADMKW